MFFTGTLWLLGAWQLARSEGRRSRWFATSFLLAMAGNMGVIVNADIVTFYLFFAIMSFAAYGLIIEGVNDQARHAGRIYMQLVMCGEIALFVAFTLIVAENDSLDTAELGRGAVTGLSAALVLVGFGIKAGLIPVHVSLPLAYAAAPSSARMVLAGAMLNAGVLGWLRFLPFESALPNWGEGLTILGVISVFYGVVCGLGQNNAPALLAYSSVSQMGYVLMLLGGGLMNPAMAETFRATLLLFVLHHAFAKAALFWGYDLLGAGNGVRRILAGSGLAIAAAALAGAPLTSGALAKLALVGTLAPAETIVPGVVTYILPLGAVATTLLMARFLLIAMRSGGNSADDEFVPLVPYGVLVFLVVGAAGYVGTPNLNRMAVIAPATVWGALWRVILGLIVAVIGWMIAKATPAAARLRVPAGDLLVLVETGSGALCSIWVCFTQRALSLWLEIQLTTRGVIAQLERGTIPSALPWSSAATGILFLTIFLVLLGFIFV